MSKKPKPIVPATCEECGSTAKMVDSARIYPNRKDLWGKPVWLCGCGAYVGSHPGTQKPLGTCAGYDLRQARMKLHNMMVDPIWMTAHHYYPGGKDGKALAVIKNTARRRVYLYLSETMKIPFDDTHIAMFDIEQCRSAWRALRGRTYEDIRAWAHKRKEAENDSGTVQNVDGGAQALPEHGRDAAGDLQEHGGELRFGQDWSSSRG